MSSFAWIDSSPDDRRRILDAVAQLKDADSRDELGLATIRDGFANTFFPGTGTLQTRAGYFLFVPWIYRLLHARKVTHEHVASAARREELRLIDALLASDDTLGVIGKVSGDRLKRLPSGVYWNGLRTWRIFQHDLTIDGYHQQFESLRGAAHGPRDDDRNLMEGGPRADWHPTIPAPPEGFPQVASFTLREEDRAWLTERITMTVGPSLLAWLLRHAVTLDAATPWEHPQAEAFPEAIQRPLGHARCFSEAMHGAAFLYNLILAEELPAGEHRDALVAGYREALEGWSERLRPRGPTLLAWDLSRFWETTAPLMRVTPSTRAFVDAWVGLRAWTALDGLAGSVQARQLIRHRERQLKGPRARIGNPRALALWGQDSGTRPLVYRWPSAVRILQDLRPELDLGAES